MQKLMVVLLIALMTARRVCMRFWTILCAHSPAQGLVEYGLILVLLMVVCVGILTAVGRTTSQVWYDKIIQAMP